MFTSGDSYVLAIDQGTSGTMASLYDRQGKVVASVDKKVSSSFPQPGWVEQDPFELLESIRNAVQELIHQTGIRPEQILSMGLANQGESLILWDLATGMPVYNVIGWQCTRSLEVCEQLKKTGQEEGFIRMTGLPIDPEWPATKIPWVFEHVPGSLDLASQGRLVYSQLDAWFARQLTREHNFFTDPSTASRSGFFNIHSLDWDDELRHLFQADELIFPNIVDSNGFFGTTDFGDGWLIPWRGGCLDQSAALLGQGCILPGDTKITYGTCVGFWVNLGSAPKQTNQLATSIAWSIDGKPIYAIAGEVNTAAAALEWLREELLTGWTYEDFSERAHAVAEDEGLVFVTALTGLGAPHWAPHARGTIYGLTSASKPDHIARAALEAVAFSVRDLSESLAREQDIRLSSQIIADGGMISNRFLMQFQADILGKSILLPVNNEGTSAGVAMLAGLFNHFFPGIDFLKDNSESQEIYTPRMSRAAAERCYQRWCELVAHTITAYPTA